MTLTSRVARCCPACRRVFLAVVFLAAPMFASAATFNWLDPMQGTGLTPTAYLRVLVDANGKRLVMGSLSSGMFVMRVKGDNTLDTTFAGVGYRELGLGGTGAVAKDMLLQSDGKIVVLAWNNNKLYLTQLDGDGNVVTGFGTSGVAIVTGGTDSLGYTTSTLMALDGSDRILLCTTASNASDINIAVFRLASSGGADATFGTGGRTTIGVAGYQEICGGIAVTAGGKVVLGGGNIEVATSATKALYSALDDGGAPVSGLPASGYSTFDFAYFSPALLRVGPGGALYWMGRTSLLRTDDNGVPDTSFGTGGLAAFDFQPYYTGSDLYFDAAARPHVLAGTSNASAIAVLTTAGQYSAWQSIGGTSVVPRSIAVSPASGVVTLVGEGAVAGTARYGTVTGLQVLDIGSLGSLGTVQLGGTYSRSTTVTNVSDSTVTLAITSSTSQLTWSGCAAAIAPGAGCTLTATVKPVIAGGLQSGTLSLKVGGVLQGTAGIDWYPQGMPQPQLSADGVSMVTGVGQTITYDLVIRNPSSAYTMSIGHQVFASGFSLLTSCTGNLAPLAKCTLRVAFSPTASGQVLGELDIYSNADTSTRVVVLGGDTVGAHGVQTVGGDITASPPAGGGGGTTSGGGGGGGGAAGLPWLLVCAGLALRGRGSRRRRTP